MIGKHQETVTIMVAAPNVHGIVTEQHLYIGLQTLGTRAS